jgi:soluble lytic murein transglycosylase-like protein
MAWAAGLSLACGMSVNPARADVFVISADGMVRAGADGAAVQSATGETAPAIPDAAITQIAAPQVPDAWRASLQSAAIRYHLSPDLLAALVWQESRWHPNAKSAKGAVGLAQLMPATARQLAVDPRDPDANLTGGARYLRQLLDRFDGDVERALAAYNAGPGRVDRAGGVPAIAETRSYVSTIFDRLTPVSLTTGLLH